MMRKVMAYVAILGLVIASLSACAFSKERSGPSRPAYQAPETRDGNGADGM